MDIEAYFERIGYKNSVNKLDLATLTEVLQHQMRAVPFENLNMHCGEAMHLDLQDIFDHIKCMKYLIINMKTLVNEKL